MARERDADGKVVLVTGAEDDDLGAKLATSLATNGYKLVLAGQASKLQSIAHNGETRVVELDLFGDEKSIGKAVEKAWNAFGRVDVLLFCSTYQGSLTPVLEINEPEWDRVVTSNLKAAWLVSKAVARRIRDAGTGGSIVFLTSIAGSERGLFPGTSVYSTCMAGIHHLAKTMALEVGKYGIRVNAVVRGFCESDIVLKSLSGKLTAESVSKLLPLQRWADASRDFSSAVLFFAGDESSFITGSTVMVDGGQSLVRPRLRARF